GVVLRRVRDLRVRAHRVADLMPAKRGRGGREQTLFGAAAEELARASAPLAARMRPRSLDEFEGQMHLLAEGKPLRVAVERGRVGSMILWGPPGSGKTTLA